MDNAKQLAQQVLDAVRWADALADAGLYGSPQHQEAIAKENALRQQLRQACLAIDPHMISLGNKTMSRLEFNLLGKVKPTKGWTQEAKRQAIALASGR